MPMKTVLSFLFLVVGLAGLRGQAPRLVVPIGHTAGISSVAFSPNGMYILTGGSDHTAKLWEIKTGREIQTFKGHIASVSSVTFSPDGKYIWEIYSDSRRLSHR
ncbi:MAG: hypothetical protein DYG98_15870 [Haliscomenobacteraceae bacterium CHB4]|nr:hypothetical protein [Haliscomenobacteraceae bacterium CHB4]